MATQFRGVIPPVVTPLTADEMLPRDKPCFTTALGPHGGSFIRTGDGARHHDGRAGTDRRRRRLRERVRRQNRLGGTLALTHQHANNTPE